MLSRFVSSARRVNLISIHSSSIATRLISRSIPATTQSLHDLPALLATHGAQFADKLNEDSPSAMTAESFRHSLRHLISQQRFSSILDLHRALPASHRLVAFSNDLTFAAMTAYSGMKRPLKVSQSRHLLDDLLLLL
jgi:hypothetical protein